MANEFKVKNGLRLPGSTSGYVGLKAPAIAGSTDFVLPNTPGTNGQVLQTNGSGVLSWATPSGGGLSDSTTSTQSGYFGDIYLYDDSTPSHYLRITNSANLTAQRTLNISVNDADRTISLSGNLTVSSAATISGTNTGDQTTISGNAGTATTLQTARTINGTSFNGSANITTANWGTARTLTIGSTGKSVNGSANISWSLAEIGALANVTPGTSGNVLTSNGTSWVSQAPTTGGQYLGTAATKAIAYNSNTIGENITVTTGLNGLSAGPVTISNGFTVTIESGAVWVIV